MNPLIVIMIIGLAVLIDCFWLDVNKKRWGWMKNWNSLRKGIFFSGFIIVSVLIYVAISAVYF
ncbi:hypothetical protein [Niallia sp. FSL W8-0635]|uniref:hypothetical protein n=1 Tax=Niallia sp. FSL W8-0635 TaxID=2975337 RepID=UPI0009CB1181|nr:Uncharacterised protein [Mycobacteroides abscessus subsp. abscessus]HEO8419255.1 hypothetical protein [Yersinia enterocolitica]